MIKQDDGYQLAADDDIQHELEEMSKVEEVVSVWTGELLHDRTSFFPSISVCGKLGQHDHVPYRFRIVNDDGNYVYFNTENVNTITVKNDRFKDGSKAVIRISFKTRRRRTYE
jgi:hypothetical protein